MRLSAGDAAPDRPWVLCALDWVLDGGGLAIGGRMEYFLLGKRAAGRGRPAIETECAGKLFGGKELRGRRKLRTRVVRLIVLGK